MAEKKTYSDKLKDPRWQRVRLSVFNRDGFQCQDCGSKTKTLHVHHKFYSNIEPWEYPLESLVTLCYDCHEAIDKPSNPERDKLDETIASLRVMGYSYLAIEGALRPLLTKRRELLGRVSSSFLKDLDVALSGIKNK